MAARRYRVRGGRRLDAGAAAVRSLAGSVPHLSGPGLADRRRRRRPLRRSSRAAASPAGGSASDISSPGSTGSATPSWSTPRPSAGCCRSRSPRCRRALRSSPAFGFALARLLWTRGPMRMLALAVALTAAEWLRGHLLTGFPWNAFGYALTGPLVLAQTAALIGLLGPDFLAVAIFASPAVLADDRADTRRRWLPLASWRRRARGACRLTARWRLVANADDVRRRRAAAHHAAQSAAGREIQLSRAKQR